MDRDGSGVLVRDLFASMGADITDDLITFTADGKWNQDAGASKRDPVDPQIDIGSWTMTAK